MIKEINSHESKCGNLCDQIIQCYDAPCEMDNGNVCSSIFSCEITPMVQFKNMK